MLIVAPIRDSRSVMPRSLYWWLRAVFYTRFPGFVRFYDAKSLPRLLSDHGLTVLKSTDEPGRVSVLASAKELTP